MTDQKHKMKMAQKEKKEKKEKKERECKGS